MTDRRPLDGVDHGRRVVTLRLRGRVLGTPDLRALIVGALLLAAAVALAFTGLVTGSAAIPVADVLAVLAGDASPYANLVVGEWRMPRIALALVLGACLAVSGAIFQNLTENPLGSPDVIGFQTGAYTGALVVMLHLRLGTGATIAGSLLGGLLTAVLVLALSTGRRNATGMQLVIVGIGVSAILAAVNTWMLLRATVEDAMMASLWGAGTLAGANWDKTVPVLVAAVPLLAAAVVLARAMRVLELGVPAATALGLRVRAVQLSAVVVGVALTALATATAGPIAFIALAAPHIARRLTRTPGVGVWATAATGAFLLTASDLVAQRIHPSTPLPVGIVTVSIGGLYFLWLLLREGKRSRA